MNKQLLSKLAITIALIIILLIAIFLLSIRSLWLILIYLIIRFGLWLIKILNNNDSQKLLPVWAKRILITAIIIIGLLSALTTYLIIKFILMYGGGLSELLLIIPLTYIAFIVGMCVLGFLYRFLLVKNKKWLSNLISLLFLGVGLFMAWPFLLLISARSIYISSHFLYSNQTWLAIPGLFLLIHSIISLMLINRSKSLNNISNLKN